MCKSDPENGTCTVKSQARALVIVRMNLTRAAVLESEQNPSR